MLHLDPVGPRTPRMPGRRLDGIAQAATSAVLHAVVLSLVASIEVASSSQALLESGRPEPIVTRDRVELRHIVFLAPTVSTPGAGGGGGGNQQPGPIRRAQGIGSDPITLRVRTPAPAEVPLTTALLLPIEDAPPLPSIALDAKPMASGTFDQTGLPAADGPVSASSTGPGSGGGVGTGIGTGIGSGRGPGVGAGWGGGSGGGVYRPGGAVSAPRLVKQVTPVYTSGAALKKIQGAVRLETVVKSDGCPSQIRVIGSLDSGGLDEQAVAAVAQWRFEPGRLAGIPVDVLVTIEIDFRIR